MNRKNGKIIPLVKLSFSRGITSKTVREAIAFIRGVCPEEGAVVSTVIERRPECGGRLTTIVARSAAPFDKEEAALIWWQKTVSRLEKELPHRQLLADRLSEMSFSYTTPEILDLLRSRNGCGRSHAEAIPDRGRGASGIVVIDSRTPRRPSTPTEESGETG